MNRRTIFIIAAVLLMSTAACGPQESSASADTPTASTLVGDASNGEMLFRQGKDEAPGCITCHRIGEGGFGIVLGPNLAGVSERAATRIEGMSAEEYILQSILSPDAFVVPGYRELMFSRFGEIFTEQEIADVIAYLMTL